MSRSLWMCLLAFGLTISGRLLTAAERPNILFIYTDDHSYRTTSCYPGAYEFTNTPHIAELASDGVRFSSRLHRHLVHAVPSDDAHRASTVRHRIDAHGRRLSRQRLRSREVPSSGPRCSDRKGIKRLKLANGTRVLITGPGRDWDYQVVWNRPRYPENSGNYFDNQLIETNGGKPVMTKGYTTDRYTDLAGRRFYQRGKPRRRKNRGTCGSALVPFTVRSLRQGRHLDAYPDISASRHPPTSFHREPENRIGNKRLTTGSKTTKDDPP